MPKRHHRLMSLEFHHFFVFTGINAPAVDHLLTLGFCEGSRNIHKGQGTANRRLFFSNGMIEFLWVADEKEIRSAPASQTLLFARHYSKETGFAPFGVGLCTADKLVVSPFESRPYRPKYFPKGVVFWNAANEKFPWEPMIFYLEGAHPPGTKESSEPINHGNGAAEIELISLRLARKEKRESDALKAIKENKILRFVDGAPAHAHIQIKTSGRKQAIDLSAWCPLSLELV